MSHINETNSAELLLPTVHRPAKRSIAKSARLSETAQHASRLAITTICCLSVLAFTGVNAFAATSNIQTSVSASKHSVGVADPFNVTIEAIAPKGVTVRFPEIGDQMGDFEIITHRDTMDVPSSEGRRYQRQLTLETLKTGQLNVPEFEVFFKDNKQQNTDAAMASVKTDSIPITVQSAIAATDDPSKFRDLKNVVFLDEPATAHAMPWINIAALGGLGLLGVAGFVVLNQYRKRLTPKQKALRALDTLANSETFGSANSKFVYEGTTQVLRTFIESQFDFPATCQTTEEFLAAVNADRRLGEPLQRQLKQFLESADMVKFAGLSCSESVLKESINQARQFVLKADEQKKTEQRSPSEFPARQQLASLTSSVTEGV